MNPMLTLGAASWTELMTTDLDAAIAFYKAVFGWKVEVAPMSAGPYGVGQVDGKYISGMMSLPQEGMPPYWGVYFTVADVEATVAKATELGGTVIMDTFDAPEVGTMAVLQDPQEPQVSHCAAWVFFLWVQHRYNKVPKNCPFQYPGVGG
jgi:predicted enzyme related to lactoylglutathione lyase